MWDETNALNANHEADIGELTTHSKEPLQKTFKLSTSLMILPFILNSRATGEVWWLTPEGDGALLL